MAEPADSGRVTPAIDAGREALLKTLVAHAVQFVVIGGAGIQSHGVATTPSTSMSRPTVTRPTCTVSLMRSTSSTAAWSPIPRTQPPGCRSHPTTFTPRTLLAATVWNLATRHGQLDLTFAPSGFPDGYGELAPRAERLTVAGTRIAVLVAALDDIHKSKRAADRPKDRAYFLAAGEARRD
jgi:hypothetical protein